MGATAAASSLIGSNYLVTFHAKEQRAVWGMIELAEQKYARERAEGAVQRTGGREGRSATAATADCYWMQKTVR